MTEKAALLIRRRRLLGESPDLAPGSIPGTATLRGTAGAARALASLHDLDLRFETVVQAVVDPDLAAAAVDQLDAGRRFRFVILGSHLVNTPDEALRRSFLRAACRHLVGDGDVLVEHHPIDWAETAAATSPTPGAEVGMVKVRRDPPFVSAVSVYDVGGREARQPFTARVLSEAELETELGASGLRIRRRLSPTWLQAGPIEPAAWVSFTLAAQPSSEPYHRRTPAPRSRRSRVRQHHRGPLPPP